MAKGWGKKGIGDYIHYKASDYYRYGLNIPLEDKSTTSNSSSLISADLNRIHQEILADSHLRGDESKAKELEKQLNRFYNRDSKEVTDKFTDDEYKMIESTLSNNVSNITDNLVIDTKHLDADYIVDTYGLRGAHSELMAKSSDGKIGLRIKSIEHMMKDLQMVLNNIYAKYGPQIDAGVMSQNFTTLVKEAESSLKAIEAQFGTLTELQQSNPNSLRRFSGGRGQALQNFQEKYNNLRKYLIQSKAFTKGQLGEFGTAAILAAAQSTSAEQLKKLFEGLNSEDPGGTKTASGGSITISMTGNESSQKALNTQNFGINFKKLAEEYGETANKYEREFLKYSSERDENGDIYALKKSQDKVDVSLIINDEPINLSIKNYDFTSKFQDITIHGGNLLRLIQDYTNLINHLLNVIPAHQLESDNYNYKVKEWESQIMSVLQSTILVKGLQGGMYTKGGGKTAEADQMVVHYKSKNGYAFRVMSMRTLVNLIEERKNLFKVTYRPGLGNNQNEYIGDKPNIQQGYARSHKMVRQFAKISIAAKINNRAFL